MVTQPHQIRAVLYVGPETGTFQRAQAPGRAAHSVVVGWEPSEQCGWQPIHVKAITLFHSEVIWKLYLEEHEKKQKQ